MNTIQHAIQCMKDLFNSMDKAAKAVEKLRLSSSRTVDLIIRNKAALESVKTNILPQWQKLMAQLGMKSINEGPDTTHAGPFSLILAQNIIDGSYNHQYLFDGITYEAQTGNITAPVISHPMGAFFSSDPVPDSQRGDTALQFFYNEAISLPEGPQNMSYDDFKSQILSKSPAFLEGLGAAINSIDQSTGYSDSQVQLVMGKLAFTGNGALPTNLTTFFNSIGQDASNPNFWDGIAFTTSESAKQIASGVRDVGQGLVSAAQTTTGLLKYLPYILLAAGGLYVFTLAGGPASLMRRK